MLIALTRDAGAPRDASAMISKMAIVAVRNVGASGAEREPLVTASSRMRESAFLTKDGRQLHTVPPVAANGNRVICFVWLIGPGSGAYITE